MYYIYNIHSFYICISIHYRYVYIPIHSLEKEMATHSSALAWRIPGTVEPGGLLSMG